MIPSLQDQESSSALTFALLTALGLGACSPTTPDLQSPKRRQNPEYPVPASEIPNPAPLYTQDPTGERALAFSPYRPSSEVPLHARVQHVTSVGIELSFVIFDSRNYQFAVADKEGGPDTEWTTSQAAAAAHNAVAAINASFFDKEGQPLGLVIEEGRRIGRGNSQSALTSGVFTVEKGPRLLRRRHWRSFSPTRHLVQAGPFLVENDNLVHGLDDQKSSPRSFLVWDGRSSWAFGYTGQATLAGLGRALAAQPLTKLSITTALNLDGGRSSDLWVSPLITGGPLNTRKHWNKPVRNYILLQRLPGSEAGPPQSLPVER